MPSLEQFVYKLTKHHPADIGHLSKILIDPNNCIPTRPSLNQDRLTRSRRRRAGSSMPDLIITRGQTFIIDGHHRLGTATEPVVSRVLETDNPSIVTKLARMCQK